EARLMAVTLTPGNRDAYWREQLEFDQTSQWVDDNVTQIHAPAVEIAALGAEGVPIGHARQLAAAVAGVRLVTVDGNHMIPYTHPDVVVAEINNARATLKPAG